MPAYTKVKAWRLPVLTGLLIVSIGFVGCGGDAAKEESRNYCERGRTLGKQGKYHEAMVAFNRAVAANPENADAHNGLGHCYVLLGQDEMGERHLKAALRLQPDLVKTVKNLASLYHRQQRMKDAAILWEQLTEIRPSDAEAWSHLSTAYMSEHQIEKALVAAKRALDLAPNNPTVVVNYASMQKGLMNFDEAEQCYRKVVDMSPPDEQVRSLAITGLFDVYFLQGDYSKAKVVGLKAKELFPNDFKVYYNLALLHEKLGENDHAAKYHEEAMRRAPGNVEMLVRSGDFFSRIGDQDRAESIYRRAIDIDPKFVKAYLPLITAGIEDGHDLAETEKLCEKALSFADQYEKPRVLDQMSVLKRKRGDLDAAIRYGAEAIDGLPKGDKVGEAMVRTHLAATYKAKGDLALTKRELEAALALSPPEAILKEIETVASDLPPEWAPDLSNSEPQQSQGGSN